MEEKTVGIIKAKRNKNGTWEYRICWSDDEKELTNISSLFLPCKEPAEPALYLRQAFHEWLEIDEFDKAG